MSTDADGKTENLGGAGERQLLPHFVLRGLPHLSTKEEGYADTKG